MGCCVSKLYNYVVVIPAYNEASRIGSCLEAIKIASEITMHRLVAVVIALNGCTDNTADVINSTNAKLCLPVTILHCERGYTNAINTLFSYAKTHYPDEVMLKTDADSVLRQNAIDIMLGEFVKHPELVIVGGHPLPLFQQGSNMKTRIKTVKARMLSLRSLYPLSQISLNDTGHYHTLALSDPQPNIMEHEIKLKTFFHGRLWSVRKSAMMTNLGDTVIGDDVYLTVWVYKKYGPNAIRVRYDANTMYYPYDSFVRHWKVYKRIHEDTKRVLSIPEYEELEELQRTRLDWRYIFTNVPMRDKLLFMVYGTVVKLENVSFGLTKYQENFWQYTDKEGQA